MTLDPAAVRAAFADNFARGVEVGASVAVWQRGHRIVWESAGWRDAARTVPWTPDTLVLIWSATKGLSSACVLHALEATGRDLSCFVADFWPEFGQGGKNRLTVGDVLSHQAGLAALEDRAVDFRDHAAVVRALEKQAPLWPPGEGHGYGPRTYGFLADELVRRLTNRPLGEYWRHKIAGPMNLDLWIGLPEEQHGRVAAMLAARSPGDAEDEFSRAMARPDSLTRQAFSTPAGPLAPSAMNTPAMRAASLPSLGAIGTADSLARFYAMLADGGTWEGRRFFSPETLRWMTSTLTSGLDQTLRLPTAFSAGFMRDVVETNGQKPRPLFGPARTAFGHPGAGGSLAFADPDHGVGFAYVMNQMEAGVLPRGRALGLVRALYNFS